MRVEHYTLPVLALFAFAASLWFNMVTDSPLLRSPASAANGQSGSAESTLFGNATAHTAAVGEVTRDRLVAYWNFNEGEGVTVLDGSLKGNTGVLTGGPQWVAGREGTGLYLDGVDDHVIVNDSITLDLTNRFTLAAWVKPDERHVGRILSKNGFRESTRGGYVLSVNNDTFEYSVQGLASIASSRMPVLPKTWRHVVVTYSSGAAPTTRLFIDGQRVLSSSVQKPIKNSEPLLIGRGNDGLYFKGVIDEVRIYDKAFLDSDIEKIYAAYNDVPFPPENVVEEEGEMKAGTTAFTEFFSQIGGVLGAFVNPQ